MLSSELLVSSIFVCGTHLMIARLMQNNQAGDVYNSSLVQTFAIYFQLAPSLPLVCVFYIWLTYWSSFMLLFQVRGPRKHLKRLNAPKHWMLDKLGGVFVSTQI